LDKGLYLLSSTAVTGGAIPEEAVDVALAPHRLALELLVQELARSAELEEGAGRYANEEDVEDVIG
jgi:hypothetical protein